MPPDANSFWQAHAVLPKTLSAVSPGTPDTADTRWRRERMQAWTIARARHHLGPRWDLLVDLGCGYGDWTARLAARAARVRACDVAEAFCIEADRQIRAVCPQVSVTCADVRTFDAGNEIQLAHVGGVLTYLDDDDARNVLGRLRGRLRADGLVITRDWCAVGLGRRAVHPAAHFSVHRRPRDYVRLAARAGLRVIEVAPSWRIYGEASNPLGDLVWRLRGLAWRRASVGFVMRPA